MSFFLLFLSLYRDTMVDCTEYLGFDSDAFPVWYVAGLQSSVLEHSMISTMYALCTVNMHTPILCKIPK